MNLIAFLLLALVACHSASPAPASAPGATTSEGHSDEAEHAELPKVVKLSPQLAEQVATSPAERRVLDRTVELNGQLVSDPDAIAVLGPRIAARVASVKVREGDRVRRGQPLVELTSSELARLRAELTAAQAKVLSAAKNAERVRGLAKDRLASEQEAVAAESDATATRAELKSDEQHLRAVGVLPTAEDPARFVLTSPLDGEVVQRDAVLGETVEPDHVLVTVADLSRAGFQAQLFEKDLSGVQVGAVAEVRLNGYPDVVYAGKVTRISARVDPEARTLAAWIALAQPDARMRLGLFGVATVSLPAEGPLAIVVPLSAVVDVGEQKVVFVHRPDGDYEFHPVTLGRSASGQVEVLAGVREGEQVAIRGTHLLRSVVLKSSLGEDD